MFYCIAWCRENRLWYIANQTDGTDAPFNRPACFNIEGAVIIDLLYDTKEDIAFRSLICPLIDALHGIMSYHHVVLLQHNSVLHLAKATWELAFWPKKATVLFEIPTIRDVFLVVRESHQPPTTNHTRPEHTVESPRYTQFWSHVSLFLVWTRVQVVNNRMATPLIQTFNHDQSNVYSVPGRPIPPCTGRKATNLLVCVSLGQLAQTYSGEFRYRKFGFQNTELYRHYVRFDCSIAHSKALSNWNRLV